jgi:Peptidase_C39 like family
MFTVNPLSQNDPAWKFKRLGFDNSNTIGKWGCLLTCLAMVANRYGYDETPLSLNDKLKALGPNVGFMGALVIPASLPRLLTRLRFRNYIECHNSPAPLTDIDASLAAEMPVIVEVDYSAAPGLQNHWVVLYQKSGGDYLIRDPWPYPSDKTDVPLTVRFGFAGSSSSVIQAALWFEGPTAPPPVDTGEPATMQVVIIVDGLALRQQPFIGTDNLIGRLTIGAQLGVLDAEAEARSKIGAINQWLHVRDPQGNVGYVAAWYVSLPDQPAPQPTGPAPEPTGKVGENLIVQSTVDGLALRTQPVVADNTLLKRLPFDSDFLVLEEGSAAAQKLGKVGEWLNVQDVEGDRGYAAAWYLGTMKQPPLGPRKEKKAPPPPPGTDTMVVRTLVDGLNMRAQPQITGDNVVKLLPRDGELLVLEPASTALAKLGVDGQWLNVRDIEGDEGYVAAWYVGKRPEVSF